jgi:small-conductance mechanosensitive channel
MPTRARSDRRGASIGALRAGAGNQGGFMNRVIYIVGLVVVVIAILSFFGLR